MTTSMKLILVSLMKNWGHHRLTPWLKFLIGIKFEFIVQKMRFFTYHPKHHSTNDLNDSTNDLTDLFRNISAICILFALYRHLKKSLQVLRFTKAFIVLELKITFLTIPNVFLQQLHHCHKFWCTSPSLNTKSKKVKCAFIIQPKWSSTFMSGHLMSAAGTMLLITTCCFVGSSVTKPVPSPSFF